MSETIPPSGTQIELAHADLSAVIVEVGGALRGLRLVDWNVLDGYDVGEMAGGGRGQPLLPWPNRLRDGRYRFEGEDFQLSISEPPTSTAIHGLVRWANWTVADRGPSHVRMEHVLHAQSGYPFVLALAIEYALDDAGLTVRMEARNRGARPCPFGAGQHPYLAAGTPTIDACRLRVPGQKRLRLDDRSLPAGSSDAVAGGAYDFREERELGSAQLDTCFFHLARDDDGRARTVLRDPAGGRAVTLWQDEQFPFVMVFTGDTLPSPHRRRGLAVEPMTCAPDAFNSGDGLLVLGPGETFVGSWGITPERALA